MAVVLTALAVLTPIAARAQQPASDAYVAELMKKALQQVGTSQAPAQGASNRAVPVVDLKIEEAVGRAMEQNIDLSVARLNPQIQDLALAGIRASYRPTVGGTLGDQSSSQMPNNTLSGATAGQITSRQVYTFSPNLTQILPWTGGTATLSWDNTRTFQVSNNFTVNPSFSAGFTARLVQPLWQNFRIDSTRNSLWTGIISRQIADVNLRASVINTEASTRIAYWNLVYAVQNLEVQKQSLALAEKLVQDNQAKVEIGTLAPLDVIQAQAQAATARANVVTAQQTRTNSEIALKRLIVGSAQDPLWTATLNPVDRPEPPSQAPPIDLQAAIRNALDQRTDLAVSRQTLKQSDITLKYNKNLTLPSANLTAAYGANGTGGDVWQRVDAATGRPTNTGGIVSLAQAGGYTDALSIMRSLNVPTWNLSVQFSYPIGTSAGDAAYARAKVQYQQSLAQLKSAELQAATQVTTAALNVQNSLQQVETRRAARELAQKQLEAEQSKFEVGMSTNYNVVQMQNALLVAQVAELQAMLSYRQNLVTFDQVQRTGNASVSGISSGTGGSSGAGGSSTGSGSSASGSSGGPGGQGGGGQ